MYCPGALRDHLYGGAKPIRMPTGGSTATTTYPALVKTMTLDIAIEDFEARRQALTLQLAAQYGVHSSLVTLQATPGSLQLTITIAATNGTSAAIDIAALTDTVNSVDSAALTESISIAMNASVTISGLQPLEETTIDVTSEFACERGQWYAANRLEQRRSLLLLAIQLLLC
jgi:hypothetical protein